MIYSYAITTPAATTEANAVKTKMKLTRGVVHKVEFTFPNGCQQLVHLRVRRGLYQVWPSNAEASFATDGETIAYREHYQLDQAPFELEARTWNDDANYSHTILVRVGILRKDILTPWLRSWQEQTANAPDS